jgi:antitoxin (DNA-binding transcriptional repressor) of toxin-antitoxin stability system
MHHMERASIRDLRYDFKRVEDLLKAGEEVEITRRRRVIARLVPPPKPRRRVKMPDFEGRMRRIFGDKVFTPSGAELIAEGRERF